MATVIPTYQLDQLIADNSAGMTLQQLKTAQLQALPYECPQCDGDGLVSAGTGSDGSEMTTPCPLCAGMGKTAVLFLKECAAYQYTAQPDNPPA